ncbi:putative metal-dependent hydrolase [Candidatus Vecturithrix granuli]|uniref:Putative metal-dependent hydrolase n=1 Tax=Vecturithrix granuli TaxID=1499967 RepID=A0A081C9Y0_VECG1|nr:putative metal-dependent hydrolase [Candidatus Vecturithrix granuli]
MDLTILSARIFTGEPACPWAEALCIQDQHVVTIGTNTEVRQATRSQAEILELPGRLITPGFVDAHTHFLTYGLNLQWVDLRNETSLAACRRKIRDTVASYRPGEWIIGRSWNHHLWEEGREPTRHDLDDLAPENPMLMIRICGHSIWVNSLALKIAGITRDTPQPPGGKIDKDVSGEPTGLIREARELIEAHIPPASLEQRKKAALAAQQEVLRAGVTSVRSMEHLEQWEALQELDQEEQLKLRIYHLLAPEELAEAATRGIVPGYGSDRLWFGQAKLFADGSLGSDTALLHEPYLHKPGDYGLAYLSVEELREKVELAYSYGCDVAIHTIGDKAVSNALDAIGAARKVYPGPRRDSLEHVQLFRPQDLDRFLELQITASPQPPFIVSDWEMADKKWGPERCRYAYALKSFFQHGIPTQFSSDMPVELCNPLAGIQAAVTRQTPEGEPSGGWHPEQRLTLEEAITGYTHQYAWVFHREQQLGSLAPGKWADVTILNQDLFQIDPHEWSAVTVEMTIIDGEIAYHNSGSSS